MLAEADFLRRALGHDFAAMHAGAGPHVDHVVGGADRVLVVLDHQHRIADVAQMLQRGQQAVVVALMQADRGFVEHVHHAGEAGADLRRQADALRFATRERVGGAVERQIVEPDVVEKTDAGDDFLDDLVGDPGAMAFECQGFKKCQHLFQRHRADFIDGHAADHDVARFLAQSRALARGTGFVVLVFGEFLAYRHRVGFVIAPLHVGEYALERIAFRRVAAARRQRLEGDRLAAGAVEDHVLDARRQRFPRRVEFETVMHRQALQHHVEELVTLVPALDRAAGQRQMREGDHPRRIEEGDLAQAITLAARAHRVVEREQARLQFGQCVAADRAGEFGGEEVLLAAVHFHRQRATVGVAQRGLEAFGQTLLGVGTHFQTIDHHLDGVLPVFIQLGYGVDLVHRAIDPHPHEALRP